MADSEDSSEKSTQRPCSVIVLDDAHKMDQASWQFFEAIRDDCTRVCILMCMQTDENDQFKIPPANETIFNTIWFSQQMEELYQVDMPYFEEN